MDTHPAMLAPTSAFFMHSVMLTERVQSEASVVAKLEKELAAKVTPACIGHRAFRHGIHQRDDPFGTLSRKLLCVTGT